jgi:hypothetical protein
MSSEGGTVIRNARGVVYFRGPGFSNGLLPLGPIA